MHLAPGVNENSLNVYDENNRKLNRLAFESRTQLSKTLSKSTDKTDKRASLLKILDKDEVLLSFFLILERLAKLQETLEGADIGFENARNIKELFDEVIETGNIDELKAYLPSEGYTTLRFFLGEFLTGEQVGALEIRFSLDSRKEIPRIRLIANQGINYVSKSTLEKLFGDLNIPVTLDDAIEQKRYYENEASKVFSDR